MLSAMEAAAEARPGRSLRSSLARAAEAALVAAMKSVDVLPAAKAAGVPDSGALGFAVFLDAFARSLNGKRPRALPPAIRALEVAPEWRSRMAARQLDFGVCVRFELETAADSQEVRRHFLPGHTSLVVGGTPPHLILHLHTEDPSATIARAKTLGRVSRLHLSDINAAANGYLRPRRTVLVTVVDGAGWQRLFADIGAVTVNVSEGLAGMLRGLAHGAIVLLDSYVARDWRAPRGAKIRQLRLANPPQTLAAAFAFSAEQDIATNLEAMRRNAARVQVYEAASDDEAVLLGRLRTGGLITLFCGEGVDEGAADAVADQISKAVTARVDYIYGGQAEPRYWLAFED
jgi:dihydroxyacetone kinase-like predicted kinase